MSNSSERQTELYQQKEGYEKFVIVQPKEITKILLSIDGAKVLADNFAEQLSLTQISPYQLGGGVKSSMFFGRGEIVSHILGRDNSNYIIIGSRQIRKSSLLKAIEREYQKSNEKAYYISLNEGSLVRGIAKALKMKLKSLDEVVAHILQAEQRYIFLIDEADRFVVSEKEKNYELFEAWRELTPDEPRANRLDRIIVYATVKQGEFRLKELISTLQTHGLEVDIVELERGLDRLKVSYTLDVNDEGAYFYRLPLFREYVLKGEYEVKLREEVKGWLAEK